MRNPALLVELAKPTISRPGKRGQTMSDPNSNLPRTQTQPTLAYFSQIPLSEARFEAAAKARRAVVTELEKQLGDQTWADDVPIETQIEWAKNAWINATRVGLHWGAIRNAKARVTALEEVQKELRQRQERRPIVLTTSEALKSRPRKKWLVKHLIPARGVVLIYGPPKVGKSFLALHLLASIGSGMKRWFNNTISVNGPCVYAPFEGEAGITDRVEAWKLQHEINDGLIFLEEGFNLRDEVSRREFVRQVELTDDVGAVCIDTITAAFPGIIQNADDGMGEVIAIAKDMSRQLNCVVILVHHSGKDETRGPRGSNALSGAADIQLKVSEGKFMVELAKDAAMGTDYHFSLDKVHLGEDSDGDEISSLVVSETAAAEVLTLPPDIALTTVSVRIQQDGPISQRELISKRGVIPEPKIKEAVRALKDQGKVIAVGNGSAMKLKWVES